MALTTLRSSVFRGHPRHRGFGTCAPITAHFPSLVSLASARRLADNAGGRFQFRSCLCFRGNLQPPQHDNRPEPLNYGSVVNTHKGVLDDGSSGRHS
jgi:hypothetical protein